MDAGAKQSQNRLIRVSGPTAPATDVALSGLVQPDVLTRAATLLACFPVVYENDFCLVALGQINIERRGV